MGRQRKFLTFIILFICWINVLFGQDTTQRASGLALDNQTIVLDTNNFIVKSHSASNAAWMSAIIPGLGQIYNKQWWKVPIIYAAAATVTYFAVTNNNNKNKFKDEYYNRVNGNTEALLPDYATYTDAGIYNLYNAYKSNFQLSLIVGAFFYMANILDAYVYGHLFSFEIDDNLTMNLQPFANANSLSNVNSCGVVLSIKF